MEPPLVIHSITAVDKMRRKLFPSCMCHIIFRKIFSSGSKTAWWLCEVTGHNSQNHSAGHEQIVKGSRNASITHAHACAHTCVTHPGVGVLLTGE